MFGFGLAPDHSESEFLLSVVCVLMTFLYQSMRLELGIPHNPIKSLYHLIKVSRASYAYKSTPVEFVFIYLFFYNCGCLG